MTPGLAVGVVSAALDRLARAQEVWMQSMTEDELCGLISTDLAALDRFQKYGGHPEMGAWKYALAEIQQARLILEFRDRWQKGKNEHSA